MTDFATRTASPTLPCSDAVRASDTDPVGSATAFDAFLLLDYRRPWSRTAAHDAVLEMAAPGVQDAIEAHARLRPFAVRPVQGRRTTAHTAPLGGRVGSGGYLAAIAEPLRPSAIEDLAIGETGCSAGEPIEDVVIGVCTNAKRDRCCAVRGRPVALALQQRFGSRVTEISHLGGHRFAATMLVLPSGYSYGFLAPDLAESVVRSAIDGLVDPANLRGRADLSPAAQAADAYWRRGIGAASIDAVSIEAERPAGDAVLVTGIVQSTRDIVSVRYLPGPRIDATACGGKPIATGRWSVTRG